MDAYLIYLQLKKNEERRKQKEKEERLVQAMEKIARDADSEIKRKIKEEIKKQ